MSYEQIKTNKMRKLLFIYIFIVAVSELFSQNCKLSPEAQRHWDRAIAASESIRNDDDYQSVADEFEKALEYAPNCSDIYYNLAEVYYQISKKKGISALNKAEKNIKSYMKMKPNNKEAQTLLTKIEYMQEKDGMKGSVIINGVHWATRNVDTPGTFTSKPEDPGMSYQWNSKIGWRYNEPLISSDGTSTWNSAWNGNYATTWTKANDPCPAGWRMPNQNELESLVASGYIWKTLNGMNGCQFGSGSNTIFLPAAGYRNPNNNGALGGAGSRGVYWSSTQSREADECALGLGFGSSSLSTSSHGNHSSYGLSCRCVAE